MTGGRTHPRKASVAAPEHAAATPSVRAAAPAIGRRAATLSRTSESAKIAPQ